MTSFKDKIVIHTDGACSGNPGPGGWGCIVTLPEGHVREHGGGQPATTNNQMELQAVISAFESIHDRAEDVMVCTDSTYVIRGITQWIWGWMRKGWVNAQGEPVANKQQWQELHALHSQRGKNNVSWHYVRGHQGNPGNERCDEIAVCFSKRQYCELYNGPLLQYEHNPYDLPEDTSLPPMREATPKAKAYSYLSAVNGTVERHQTWPDCERRVKGRSGAKFKKALSPADEEVILAEWGYSSKDLK